MGIVHSEGLFCTAPKWALTQQLFPVGGRPTELLTFQGGVSVDWAYPSITFTAAAVCCVATTTVPCRVVVRKLVGSRARVTDGGPDQYDEPSNPTSIFNTPPV